MIHFVSTPFKFIFGAWVGTWEAFQSSGLLEPDSYFASCVLKTHIKNFNKIKTKSLEGPLNVANSQLSAVYFHQQSCRQRTVKAYGEQLEGVSVFIGVSSGCFKDSPRQQAWEALWKQCLPSRLYLVFIATYAQVLELLEHSGSPPNKFDPFILLMKLKHRKVKCLTQDLT